jgi:hypothetical protein
MIRVRNILYAGADAGVLTVRREWHLRRCSKRCNPIVVWQHDDLRADHDLAVESEASEHNRSHAAA